MQQEWVNWSGSIRFIPKTVETLENEELLADLVRQAATSKGELKVFSQTR